MIGVAFGIGIRFILIISHNIANAIQPLEYGAIVGIVIGFLDSF